jgi:hypothetical protein
MNCDRLLRRKSYIPHSLILYKTDKKYNALKKNILFQSMHNIMFESKLFYDIKYMCIMYI